MKQYVVLSHEPWQAIPTRTQQLVTRLKRAQVLFFEPAGPKERKQGRQVRPGVFLYRLHLHTSLSLRSAVRCYAL